MHSQVVYLCAFFIPINFLGTEEQWLEITKDYKNIEDIFYTISDPVIFHKQANGQ